MVEPEFISHLRAEKLKAQDTRGTYTEKKLAYATALLGFGALGTNLGQLSALGSINLGLLLYLVPVVALAFDLYILGEDYSVKRIGAFLARKTTDPLEKEWEAWAAKNRDPFAPLAMPILTSALLLASVFILWVGNSTATVGFWIWLGVMVVLTWGLYGYYVLRKRRIPNIVEPTAGLSRHDAQVLSGLKSAVAHQDHVLNGRAYDKIADFFDACVNSPQLLEAVQNLTPEYGRSEFLRSVDASGMPVPGTPWTLDHYRTVVVSHPEFKLWFRETTIADGKPALLAARWLCHLIGLRHPTAELFIDHPTLPDHTLVQVRGLDKFEAPGCFDLPSAGHVVGTETAFDTVLKEMKEELNLDQGDILELAQIGSYPYSDQVSDGRLCNAEYRTVYRGRLADGAWQKLQFSDGEVAAIAFFSLPALRELLTKSPDRVASGLAQSLATYLETRDMRAGEGF